MKLSISDLLQLIAILGLVAAVVYGILKFVQDFIQAESRKRENYYKSFDTVVAQLSSDVKTSQLSAAILLRRYFKDTGNKKRAACCRCPACRRVAVFPALRRNGKL